MKKLKIATTLIFAVLFFCIFIMACDDPKPDTNNPENTVNAQGKVIILQAYGSSDNAAGASHSFVELYNISNRAINLNGVSLYYADGTTVGSGETNTATEDDTWARISLEGTIPAKGSFLVLGPKQSTTARYQIPDNYGDINDENFTLSNRAFKVALIQSTAQLTVQNPFNANSGKPIAGYIDMVGAANDYQGRDLIFGFETAPARNSASQAVRRADLKDYDDNSTDFIAARYASDEDGMSDEELEVRKPRNSGAGAWDPFAAPEAPLPTVAGTPSVLAGQLLILQVYGTGTATDGAVSHSFIELYNNTDSPINLNAYSLQYANTIGTNWTVINLTGTIPAKGSYLVRGSNNNTSGRLQLSTADQDAEFYLDNGNFKVALMANQKKLTVANPFDMTGGKAEDYVDLVGVKNGNSDNIDGYETALAQVISKQAAARRKNLTDNDNNSADFERIDYRSSGISNQLLEVRKPRSSSAGAWDPFAEPEAVAGSPKLMILQANIRGNNNGLPNSPTGGGFARSLVELYNNTNNGIDLSDYSLHVGQVDNWAVRIPLSGTIPAQCSFLIVSNAAESSYSVNATPRASLPVADIEADFIIGLNAAGTNVGNNWKIALMVNQSAILNVANPFTEVSLAANYVDMLGIGDNTITGFEGSRASGSAPQGPRRKNLSDTDNNANDFGQVDYRGRTGSNGVDDDQLYKIWPRNSAAGAWNPVTGLPAVHPTVQ